MYRTHLHQHPRIPLDDAEEPYISADEIHRRAVKQMYEFCYNNELSQVWAYLWNRWYTSDQWCLWARAACDAIPRLKTTMVVESLWKHLKRRDLAQFNRPRLDLVTNIVMTSLLPRLKRKLEYIRGIRRVGRPQALAGWQIDAKAAWIDKSRTDEHRRVARELEVLKSARNTKGREERLQHIADDEDRERGTYATDIDNWVCPCPAYAKDRFLMCKHLIREANTLLDNRPLTDLRFFLDLRRNHFPPYYSIPGIHTTTRDDGKNKSTKDVVVLGVRGAIEQIQRPQEPEDGVLRNDGDIEPDAPDGVRVAGADGERDDPPAAQGTGCLESEGPRDAAMGAEDGVDDDRDNRVSLHSRFTSGWMLTR